MNEYQFREWILVYFSRALDCPQPVIIALFYIEREISSDPFLIKIMRSYFYETVIAAMTRKAKDGWVRILDTGTSTSPLWKQDDYLVTHGESLGYRFEFDTFAFEKSEEAYGWGQRGPYLECNGISLVGRAFDKPLKIQATLPWWGAHAVIGDAIERFCAGIDDYKIVTDILKDS
jgi:hypothetical protein